MELKKTVDFRGRLTPKAAEKVEKHRIPNNQNFNQECENLVLDGLLARELLSPFILEDNRRRLLTQGD